MSFKPETKREAMMTISGYIQKAAQHLLDAHTEVRKANDLIRVWNLGCEGTPDEIPKIDEGPFELLRHKLQR
jgi:hypothetical protein